MPNARKRVGYPLAVFKKNVEGPRTRPGFQIAAVALPLFGVPTAMLQWAQRRPVEKMCLRQKGPLDVAAPKPLPQ